jgi:AraC-like DNA-binding protein
VRRLNGSRIGGFLNGELAIRASTATASTLHAQHGTGIIVGIERDAAVTLADGTRVRGPVVVIPPDLVHAVDSPGPTLGVLHDPEAAPGLAAFARGGGGGGAFAVGGRLAARLVDAARAHRAALARSDVLAGLARECAAVLGAPAQSRAPARRIDRRVARALEALRDPDADRRRVIEEARISEAHLQALFVRDVGVPIRSYLLWRRLLAAVAAFDGADATRAAHAAGFADLAHFSRTCRRMLGYSPTALRDGIGAEHAGRRHANGG